MQETVHTISAQTTAKINMISVCVRYHFSGKSFPELSPALSCNQYIDWRGRIAPRAQNVIMAPEIDCRVLISQISPWQTDWLSAGCVISLGHCFPVLLTSELSPAVDPDWVMVFSVSLFLAQFHSHFICDNYSFSYFRLHQSFNDVASCFEPMLMKGCSLECQICIFYTLSKTMSICMLLLVCFMNNWAILTNLRLLLNGIQSADIRNKQVLAQPAGPCERICQPRWAPKVGGLELIGCNWPQWQPDVTFPCNSWQAEP